MTLTAGTRLGPYEILAPIGAGGMGEVYRAKDSRLGREVAVKVLPPSVSADPERLRRFELEARAAGLLNHPNLTVVYDIGSHEGAPYVVQELLEGETLRSLLAGGPLSPERAVDYSVQIADGLSAAHQKGVVHRDLKPANLIVTRKGGVKILDFGLAKLIVPPLAAGPLTSLPTATAETAPGLVMGTIRYMSPEQARGLPVDHRSDIFSFGIVLYEMLVGGRPFDRETPAETTTAILREAPPARGLAASGVSRALERIVLRCLEKDPANRFQSASDLAFALRGLDSLAEDSGPRVATSGVPSGITRSVLPLAEGTRLAGAAAPAVAISRDGSKVAYVALADDGPPSLYVAHLERGETQRLPESENAIGPFFSPNGLWVGFAANAFAGSRRPGELRKHSFSSGLTQTVCALADFEGACWGDDGTIYFVGSSTEGLRKVPAEGGHDEAVVSEFRIGPAVGRRCIGYPRLLPGERAALVVDWDGSPLGDTSLLDLATGELSTFASSGSAGTAVPTGHLIYTKPDGTLLAALWDPTRGRLIAAPIAVAKDVALDNAGGIFAVSDTGTLVLARGPLQGSVFEPKRLVLLGPEGDAKPLPFPPDSITSPPALSPDQRRLAVTTRVPGLWIFDLERGTRARLPPGNTRLVRFPLWSRDGESVVFRGAIVGQMGWKVFRQRSDGGSEPEVLLREDARDKRPRGFTADGMGLVCEVVGGEGDQGLWEYSMGGPGAPRPLISGPFDESALSLDGRWLAYESGELGFVEVFIRRMNGRGGGRQVSTSGGRCPRWSYDGRTLFYFCGDRLFEVPFKAQDAEPQFGPPRFLFERRGVEGYALAPDGQGLIAVERLPDSGIVRQLQLVTGWFSELKRLCPAS